MIDDKVKIKCPKCSMMFRERAQKLRNGFQTNCQHCNRLITFVQAPSWADFITTMVGFRVFGTHRFNGQKGYGFIAPDGGGGKNVFVHISAVEKAGFSSLVEGAKVTFDIVPNKGKESAENLRVT
jgi:cold shock protein